MISKFYPAYMKEYRNQEYIENPYGFITYNIVGESVVVGDLYISPEFRRASCASDLVDDVCTIGKAQGCKYLLSTIFLNTPTKEISLLASLRYGVKILSASPTEIVVGKEL